MISFLKHKQIKMKKLILILAFAFSYQFVSAQSLYIHGSKKGEIESDGVCISMDLKKEISKVMVMFM